MHDFMKFKNEIQKQISLMSNNKLFRTDVDKDILWNTYLDSYPEGTNELYRERREYDCNCCRQFIRSVGNIVSIDSENKLSTIWDNVTEYPYNVVAEQMRKLVCSKPIVNPFVTSDRKHGTDKNHEQNEDGTVKAWEHLYYEFPKSMVNTSSKSNESIMGDIRTTKEVFKRSMEELTIDAGETILDLISQDSLYRGAEFKKSVEEFVKVKKAYLEIHDSEKDAWCWRYSSSTSISRIRNTAIGTLLIDLSEGVDLNVAVSKFESVVAPTNYKRPKELFTKKMVEEAEKTIIELGYENSLGRRFAVTEDITVNNVLFANRDAKKKMMSVFDELKEETKENINIKQFDKVEEVKIDDFIKNILPTTTNLELMVESRHTNNLMSLIAPVDSEAPTMFKWNNNFSWAYNGDITDSLMKERVAKAGGDVSGVLRFSIQWNDEWKNSSDLDAHCIEPSGNRIYFSKKTNSKTSGKLDVDIQNPNCDIRCKDSVAVENITWSDINKMVEGKYVFLVHNYSQHTGQGFTAEIEYNGEIYSYSYNKKMLDEEYVTVAEIDFSKSNGIKFIKSLDNSVSSKDIWGIKTHKFEKVNLMMFSPNYWDEQSGTGNKHYFFMMDSCRTETTPRGFFNEFLKEDLMKHKRVFECLGNKMRVEESDNQLSGVGFSSTQRNSIIAKVDGKFSRVIKLVF